MNTELDTEYDAWAARAAANTAAWAAKAKAARADNAATRAAYWVAWAAGENND